MKKGMLPKLGFKHPQYFYMATSEGFEPTTHGLEGRCSVQLSYEVKIAYLFYHKGLVSQLRIIGTCGEG